jgi:hypothetical protein
MVYFRLQEEQRQQDIHYIAKAWEIAHLLNGTGNFKKVIKPEMLYKSIFIQEETTEQTEENIVQTTAGQKMTEEQRKVYMENLLKRVRGNN